MSTQKATESAIAAANLMIEDGMPPELARALETDEQKAERVRQRDDATKKAREVAEAAKANGTSWNADTIVKKSTPPADKPAVARTTSKPDAAPAPSSHKEQKAMKTNTAKKAAPAKAAANKSAAKPAKKAAATSARTPVKDKAERKPSGKVVDILKLASRENGVSPAELNKLTEWTGAPWKWLFQNPKKTGYCDRWGYKFEVFEIEPKDGKGRAETRYKTTKKA